MVFRRQVFLGPPGQCRSGQSDLCDGGLRHRRAAEDAKRESGKSRKKKGKGEAQAADAAQSGAEAEVTE